MMIGNDKNVMIFVNLIFLVHPILIVGVGNLVLMSNARAPPTIYMLSLLLT